MVRPRLRPAFASLLLAIGLTVLAFPEVVFLGGSLSHTGLNDVIDPGAGTEVSLYPDPENRVPSAGMLDVGAQAWQLDPATKFMDRVIHDGESADWNPYSAAGMLGPETLADMKLSPFVLSTAALGASSTAFTFVLLAFVVVALYCLQQLFVRSLSMRRLAAVGACVVFLLGGWATSMLTSQMGAPYLLFPVVLYALVEFLRRPGPTRLLLAVAAYAAMLLTTFLPVVVLMLVLVHATAVVIDATQRAEVDHGRPLVRRAALLLGRQAIIPAAALAVTAFLWLPVLDAYRSSGDDISGYSSRALQAKDPIEFLSVITPRHLYRSYLFATLPQRVRLHDPTIYLGIAPVLLVVGAVPRARGLARRLLVMSIVLVVLAVAQHMTAPVLSVVGGLPGLRSISGAYWASLAGGAIAIGSGVALDTAVRAGLSWRAVTGAGVALVALFGVGVITNWRPTATAAASIVLASLLIAAVAVLAWFARGDQRRLMLVASLVLGLVVVELYSYQNHTRTERLDYEDDPPAYLAYVQERVGEGRVLNAGRHALYPEWGAAFGIRQTETLNVMQVPEYRDFFFAYLHAEGPRGKFLQIGGDIDVLFGADEAALDQMSVRYIIVADDMDPYGEMVASSYPMVFHDDEAGVRVFENEDAFPRAFLSGSLVPEAEVAGAEPRWRMDRAFTDDASLLAAAEEAGVGTDAVAGDPGSAQLTEDRNTRVRVEVEAAQPSLLVLADVFHDNWSVSVNGEPARLGRVNDVVRGVVVPAGASVVEFEYHSTERSVGIVISVASVVVLLVTAVGWAVVRGRRDRRPDEQVGPRETSTVGSLARRGVEQSGSPSGS